MAASGYMTELDTESIWDVSLETARFDKINIRIAEQLNFWVNDDAASQVTSTAAKSILIQLSEEILLDLIQSSKSYAVEKPWDFIQANVHRVSTRILADYDDILTKIRNILGSEKIELSTVYLPTSNSKW